MNASAGQFDRRRALGLGLGGAVAATALAATACSPGRRGGDSPSSTAAKPSDPLIAQTRAGAVRGVRDGEVTVWKGLRYAEAPTGQYRFAAPAPIQPWPGVREATEFGPAPLQFQLAADIPAPANQSEDCLFATVYSPGTDGRRPVIVWIPGGGFVSGAGSVYDGSAYARRGIVLVTINYRVNVFGYLYQPQRPGSGNAGLLDQLAALRWVRDNIAAFGGDPDNVTVMGESAGGMSIGLLLGMPQARGLFHRAIVQSGGARPTACPQGKTRTLDTLLHHLNLSTGQTGKLLDLPAEHLLTAAEKTYNDNSILTEPFRPLLDDHVLPAHPLDRLNPGTDLLIGTCAKEAYTFADNTLWQDRMEYIGRTAAGDQTWQRLQQIYRDSTPIDRDATLDLHSSVFVVMPSVWLAEHAHRAGNRVWQYTFDYPRASAAGAIHGSDLAFTFGTPDTRQLAPGTDTTEAQRLADTMVDTFTAFARTGTPTITAIPDWPQFRPDQRTTLAFDTTLRYTDDRLPDVQRQAWTGIDPRLVC
ncbi:carboxylesterase/lipase family protein [Nocardia pseudobrasiliensis]|uniref:Carboxylic ester hydrolase n=1 Tax=Nocardia pseudobrasiliensis TaxID=45979 RepID=A0A370I8K1_9NOCA|nr:carboxylesterase family protein [Nocardia pseudobrasiliensis]RDI66930.1 para-nitrobenzyl esterase [Nocardia pseudobrasiliensis]